MKPFAIPRMSRRTLLMGFSGFSVAASGAGAWIFTGKSETFFVSVIKDALPYIKFEDGSIEAFASTYYDRVTIQRQNNVNKIVKVYRSVGLKGVNLLLGDVEKYANFRRTMVSTFLIETDYFSSIRDENAKVRYIGYDPCSHNPFAKFS